MNYFNGSVSSSTEYKNSLSYPHEVDETAKIILTKLMEHRRMIEVKSGCAPDCDECHQPHLEKVSQSILNQQPIRFVLPAFPGKSPNPAKVLGYLPDMAEQQALIFLNALCDRIQDIYSPGAELIICSDGRVFSDVIGIPESKITAYQREIERLIKELNLNNLSTFNLDDIMPFDKGFDSTREELVEQFGQDLDELRKKVKRGAAEFSSKEDREANRMYSGLTRFLVEDAMIPGQTRSKNSIQKECRKKAYQAIIRSNAWTGLIAEKFPEAIRLSIHPQVCGSQKIGIQLLGTETWLTPWHGVALYTGDKYVLMKHSEAKNLDVELVNDESGRPSYYKFIQ